MRASSAKWHPWLFGSGLAALNAMLPPMRLAFKGAPRTYAGRQSRYMPHQGKRECARRVRQLAKAEARA